MLQQFSWGSVFLIGVPVMILLLVLAPILLPEYKNPNAERLDLGSTILSLAAVLAIIFSMKQFASEGFGWLPVVTLLAGVAIGAVFVRRQKKLTDPFVDLQLFRKISFNASLGIYTLAAFVAFGSFFFIAQYLQLVLGLSPLHAGLWSLPSSVGFVAGSMLTPISVKWGRPAFVIGGGLILAAIGFAMLPHIQQGGLPLFVTATIFYSLGISPSVILSTDLIVNSVPAERSGSAASLSETSAEMGGAVGIAVLGSIGTAVYRSAMASADLEGVSSSIKEEARETLGGAVATAQQLSEPMKANLLQTSQEAFQYAFDLNAYICATLAVVIGIVAVTLLRNNTGGSGSHG
jgi:MFS transporter, DHA2 family, multidrug resistance protein